MPGIGLVDRKELLRWADTLGSRGDFPRLIRKLILETGKGLVELGFPAGEGTGVGGWDGTARSTEATPFVPDGLSVWELSVDKNVGAKADDDYEKRLTSPDGSATNDCVYIEVLLRPWTKRGEWAKEKTGAGRWREVRAYGVDDVETWLETAPVTYAWLSELLGLDPYGITAGESWWDRWATATSPRLPADFVLAGRNAEANALTEILGEGPQVTTIKAGSEDEVLAFATALALRASKNGDQQLLARTAVVDDIKAWRSLQELETPLVLIPTFENAKAEITLAPNHHVLVPVVEGRGADIELGPIGEVEAHEALRSAGLEDDRKANRTARLARKSLLAARRSLAAKPDLHNPDWAALPGSRFVRGVLLAGRWEGRNENDVEVLEELTGKSGDDLREALAGLAVDNDPLITRVDQSWALVSPYDAWFQLSGQLEDQDLARLKHAVKTVLLEVDPALDLPAEDRWRSAIDGKVKKFSGALRSGLATSLLLAGVNGDEISNGRGQRFTTQLVAEILAQANADESGKTWHSIADLLPVFAEASPDSFAAGVLAGLQGDEPVLRHIFTDDKGDSGLMSPSSPHTGLLWALEILTWSPDHFGQAIDLLARLQEIDPGGRLGNRPSNSLFEIFCPWSPEGSASAQDRLAAIDGLRERHPEVAWNLLKSMMPDLHGIKSPINEPTYRDWKPADQTFSRTEYAETCLEIARRLVEDSGESGERWASLLDEGSADPGVWKVVREGLEANAASLGREQQDILWKSLREFIAKHRQFATTDWALPEDELAALEAIERSVAPEDTVKSKEWLFAEHFPDIGTESKSNLPEYEKELAALRREAIQAVVDSESFDGALRFARNSDEEGSVGYSLAEATGASFQGEMENLLEAAEPGDVAFAAGYFSRRFQEEGWTWLKALISGNPSLGPDGKGLLLSVSSDYPAAWEAADSEGIDVERAFWERFRIFGLGKDWQHVGTAAAKLVEFGRPCSAMRLIEIYQTSADQESGEVACVMADALDAILVSQDEDPEFAGLSQYDFQRAFQTLEKHKADLGIERVMGLEWAFFPAFGIDPQATSLHAHLAKSPEFFVQAISSMYRRGNDEQEASPEQQQLASNTYRLLSSWRRLPGQTDDGKIDGDVLRAWIRETQERLAEADLVEAGEVYIGRMISHAPADEDGQWPCETVRELLEELQSPAIEDALRIQICNNRGTTMRSPTAGGDQERALAKSYRETAAGFQVRWPRIASILRALADGYESEAAILDDEAEHRRRGAD